MEVELNSLALADETLVYYKNKKITVTLLYDIFG
jgi:hypothetical protein